MNLYCPSTPVTRGQMAVFLGAAFDFQCGIAAACTAQPNPAAAEPPLPYDPVPEQ